MTHNPKVVAAFFKAHGLPAPVPEYRITDKRKFRHDFAWPDYKLALEIQGAVWSKGAHGRGAGIMRDYEKGNLACSLGWRTLQVTPQQLLKTETAELVRTSILAGAVECRFLKD